MSDTAVAKISGKQRIQSFGRFLSGMVMPNIGAFIAWGLITAFFIPTGWIPSERFAVLVVHKITNMLPTLIGYTGGKLVYDVRGGVVGAIATFGVICGSSITMFLGAMIVGPLGAWCIKKFDASIEGKIPSGFEMLVNNFSAGIIGMLLALLALVGIGPLVQALTKLLESGVQSIVSANMLPAASLFIEPGKILFLNNAINHGVLGPIGVAQAKEVGKSIFFLLETNPGPGLGVLLAYWMFAKGSIKQSAPGAVIIHFLGGIHEIYFPYVLMKPSLIVAVIAGGASGIFTFSTFNAGLVATPSPGSIFALMAMAPKGGLFAMLAGVTVATIVSFLISALLIRKDADKLDEQGYNKAASQSAANKGKEVRTVPIGATKLSVTKIVFTCDAGMGSSAMGATTLKNALAKEGLTNIQVTHCAIEAIPDDALLIVSHASLAERVQAKAPSATYVPIKNFMDIDEYATVIRLLK